MMRLTRRRQGRGNAFGIRTLWLAFAVLAAWPPQLRANEAGRSQGASTRPAQSAAGAQPDPQAIQGQGAQNAETLTRELAVTKHDLDTLLKLLNRACSAEPPGSRAKSEADPGSAELRNSLREEHDRANRLEQDLAAARREAATRTALAAKAGDQACPLKTPADAGSADLHKSLQQENDRANGLEQELVAARREVATQTALAAKATDQASQLKTTADAGSADLRKSLQQEHDRANGLEQELVAARREVATQTALAAKAADQASQLKTTADAGSVDLHKSLQQEHDRGSVLERDLAAARRDLETQTALAAKASDEASQLKATADAGSAELRKSLEQERDRGSVLERDLAAARRDVATQTALAAKASDETKQVKKTGDANSAELRQSLEKEQERAGRLGKDLRAARRKFEKQIALAASAAEDTNRFKTTADADAADLRKSLQQEHDRANRLDRDLGAARRDVETQTALATKASRDASQQKNAADAAATDWRRSLQQEQERASQLELDLATLRYNVEMQTAPTAKTGDEVSQAKKATDDPPDLRKMLDREHDRAARLERDLAAARRDVETQTARAAKAGDEASQLKKMADSSATDLRKSLQQEHDRASRLEQDLESARRDVGTQTALAAKTGEEAARTKKAAEAASADLQKSLQQERDRAAQLERDLAAARSNASTPAAASQQAQAAKQVAIKQTSSPDTPPKPEDVAENARLIAYARLLLGRGDIGSARIVLQRATEMGSAEASFALAETYDPLVLSKWGSYGSHGDADKALDLYAKALAGGVSQAKERSDALHR